jgi:hypothetical protein
MRSQNFSGDTVLSPKETVREEAGVGILDHSGGDRETRLQATLDVKPQHKVWQMWRGLGVRQL